MPLFNFFDAYFEKHVQSRPALQLKCDPAEGTQALPSRTLIAILKVTGSILENCSNKHLYTSCEVSSAYSSCQCLILAQHHRTQHINVSVSAAPDDIAGSTRPSSCHSHATSFCCAGSKNTHRQHSVPWRSRAECEITCSCTRLGWQRTGKSANFCCSAETALHCWVWRLLHISACVILSVYHSALGVEHVRYQCFCNFPCVSCRDWGL